MSQTTFTGLLRAAVLVLTVSLVQAADGQSPGRAHRGSRPQASLAELQAGFADPDKFYAPFTFWFWDAPLDRELIVHQTREMCRQRLNPGYAHARHGLPVEQWLSPEWFACLDAARREAAAAGMYATYCDEYWWPGGQAGGRVLAKHPELAAVSLRWKTYEVQAGQTIRLPAKSEPPTQGGGQQSEPPTPVGGPTFAVAGELDESGRLRSSTLTLIYEDAASEPEAQRRASEAQRPPSETWTAPAGTWRVYVFSPYHHAGVDGSPVNYLDRKLADAFIEIAYEPYAKQFGDELGRSLPGAFADCEGDYGWRLAWSADLAREFAARKQRDIRLTLPLLFERDAEGRWPAARADWFEVVSDLYADGFFGKLSRWFAARGMYLTAHVWEESLLLQAEAVGDFFATERAFTMPGNDALVRKPLEVHDFKEVQSVAEFEGRQFMSEILGVASWSMTPVLMKQAVNASIAWGVTQMVPHGINTNRDLSQIPYPPDFFTENPYWPYLHLWTDFARRACYVNAHGRVVPDALLVCPMDSIHVLCDGIFEADRPSPLWSDEAKKINDVYAEAIVQLTDAGVEFLIGDSAYLQRMEVRPSNRARSGSEAASAPESALALGDFEFRAVVLPPLFALPRGVARKLADFAAAGGIVYVLGELPVASTENGLGDPELAEAVSRLKAGPRIITCADGLSAELAQGDTPLRPWQVEFESGVFPMLRLHRRIDGADFFWLANNTGVRQSCRLRLHGVHGAVTKWDCESGACIPVPADDDPGQGTAAELEFAEYEAFWLVVDPRATPPALSPPVPRGNDIVLAEIAGPWHVSIPRAGQPAPAPDVTRFFAVPWTAPWLKAAEASRFRYELDLAAAPTTASVQVTADESFRMWVNGQLVPPSAWDDLWRQVRTIDLAGRLVAGQNVIAVQVTHTAGSGGVILQGQAELPDGRKVPLATGAGWRVASKAADAAPRFGEWIWSERTADRQRVFFRRTFVLPESWPLRNARLELAADNRYAVYLNGVRLGAGNDWRHPATYDLAERGLVVGRNVLAVEATNEAGPAGLLAGLHVRLADGGTVDVLSDTDWMCATRFSAGWERPDFEERRWKHARSVGKYGDDPWGRFDETAPEPSPDWAAVDFRDDSWANAEVLGPPPRTPWEDVPVPMLAEGGLEAPRLEPWSAWKLSRFSGYVDYVTTFELAPPGGAAVLDLGRVLHLAEVWVNDQPVGARLWPPFRFDIAHALRPGTNTLRVRVGNLVVNEMAQFADRGKLGTWGWSGEPRPEDLEAGLSGPVTIQRGP